MKYLLLLLAVYPVQAGTLEVSCRENRNTKNLFEMGVVRSQELNSIEDPERYNDDKRLAKKLIAELDKAYDKECRHE